MLYPIYVHLGDATHAHGIEVPDFPGCFSAADDWQDVPRMVQEAVEVWCMGEDIQLPEPTALETLAANPNFTGGVWMLADINTHKLDIKSSQRPMRINISIPAGLVRDIDDYARAHGATRSGFLAQAARAAMAARS
ncbi:MAG: type II toxin-antitoxin system HicB family antitoxin [Burkholderiaceae bacterium]|nr:type II toxin-antitoxin system HicB family antitoxin [Burkholderiaceae bacterium]